MTARETAWNTLTEISEKGALAHRALAAALRTFAEDDPDRAFTTRLVHGTLEREVTLDTVIAKQAGRPTGKIKLRVLTLLRLSAYQILFLDAIPASAACNEAVKLAKKRGFAGLSGFVNGVLRGIARASEAAGGGSALVERLASEMTADEALSFRYSMPQWILAMWKKDYPEADLETMLSAFLAERAVHVRCNESRGTTAELAESLRREGGDPEPSLLRNGLFLRGAGNPAGFSAYREGRYSIQDMSAVLAGNLLPLTAGMKVLDLCAAPGGKTVHAADRLCVAGAQDGDAGTVIARDCSESKLPLIAETVARVGLTNVRVACADATVYDATLAEWADVVIADVPCSGLGVIGRKPDIKQKTQPADIAALAKIQREILTQAVRYVRPGGYLSYSTCTITRAENDAMSAYLRELGMIPVDLRESLPKELRESEYQRAGLTEDGIRILPEPGLWDGFYIAGFRKRAERS